MAYPKKADSEKHIQQNVSMPPELLQRILRFCQTEERQISWVFQKAVDEWLKARGY